MTSLAKLLCVDDDEDTLIITKYSLKDLKDVDIKWATSGEEAIEVALQFRPDLILLDVMMPKMDGVATLNAIRKLQPIAHVPIIFFTAKVQKEEVFSYIHLPGVIGVIVKPFDPLTLGSRILAIWKKYVAESSQ